MELYHYLSASSTGAIAEIGLNGVPIVQDLTLKGVRSDVPVNGWLIPGEKNELTMRLRWLKEMPFTPAKVRAKARVVTVVAGGTPAKPEGVLGSIAWPEATVVETADSYPVERAVPLEVRDFPPCHLWRDAARLQTLSAGDRKEILALTEALRTRTLARDAAGVVELQKYKIEDLARAEYHDPGEMLGIARQQLAWMLAPDGNELVSEPLTLETATYDIVAHGRVVLVRRQGVYPAVQVRKGEREFGYAVFCAKISDTWRVVR